jgi:hypothetical protein
VTERVESSLDFHNVLTTFTSLVVVHQMAQNLNLGQDTRAVHQMGFRRCWFPMDFDLSVSSNLSQQPLATHVDPPFFCILETFFIGLSSSTSSPITKEQGRKCRGPCARGRAQGMIAKAL